ncbi:hypothetical protein Trydic_g6194 [Trypoxylus dichotomus]
MLLAEDDIAELLWSIKFSHCMVKWMNDGCSTMRESLFPSRQFLFAMGHHQYYNHQTSHREIADILSIDNPALSILGTTEDNLLKVMAEFPDKRTASDDGIPSFLIRDTRFVRARPMCKITNLSLTACVIITGL